MGCTHTELLHRLSSKELTDWTAYDQLEPIGSLRDDYHTAQICAVLANIHRNSEVHPEPFKVEDFLLSFIPIEDKEYQRKDPQEIYDGFRMWAMALGAKK